MSAVQTEMKDGNRTQVMVPGILVALKTSVRGGVAYQHQAVEENADGTVKTWETTRIMDDPEERKLAGEVSGKAATAIARLCIRTSFGMLCPTDREEELDSAVVEARRLAMEFNRTARHSFVHVSAIKGRIADNDEEAIRAVCDEARDLLVQMDNALSEANLDAIKAATMKAKKLSEMMTEESASQINAALDSARQAARQIKKRGDDLGDIVANARIEVETASFRNARFAFLDTVQTVESALPSIDLNRGAALEV